MKTKLHNGLIFLFNFLVLVVIQAVLLNLSGLSINYAATDAFISGVLYGVISIGIYYYLKYLELNNQKTIFIFLNHLITALLLSYIWIECVKLIIPMLWDMSTDEKAFFDNTYLLRFILGILYFAVIISIIYIIKINLEINRQKLIEAKLKIDINEAELNKLKFQINPHFIFNSLNSISSLILSSPEKAQEMTIMLSDFFRNMLKIKSEKLIKLSDEIENILLYLNIEKVRFPDKLKTKIELKDSEDVKLPPLLLQPVIENVIKHAVYDALGEILLEIKGEKKEDFYKIIIKNNFEEKRIPEKKGTGFGLNYVNKRLFLVYQRSNLLKYFSEGNNFIVEIILPDE